MIIDHNERLYRMKWQHMGVGQFNGAFYYSKEIVKNIIPNVVTDRNWITINVHGVGCDHAIVFVHNNITPETYSWLKKYDDLVMVCGVPETCDKIKHIGKPIYLPLSIDTEYVKQFKLPKAQRQGTAYAGRSVKRTIGGIYFPQCDMLEDIPRQNLLQRMSHYEYIYAVGRTAIEAKCLGCKILPFDDRYPDPSVWKVKDNKEAAKLLQKELNIIDGI